MSRRYANSNYELTPLRRVIHKVQYGISLPATEEPIGLPMIRMNNLQNDGWDFTDLKYIELSEEEAEPYRVNPGNILFNRTNSKELVGKCEVFRETGDWVFASYLIRVVLDQTKVIPEFMSNFLSAKAGRIQIDRVSRQIIGMSNVNAEELQDLLIPLPSVEVQRSLVAEIEAARQSRKQKLAQADELLSSLDGYLLDQLSLSAPEESDRSAYAVQLKQIKGGRCDALYHAPSFIKIVKALAGCAFPIFSLDAIILNPVGGATPKRSDAELYADNGVKFLRILNIKPYEIDLVDIKFIKDTVHSGDLARSQLAKDDVLVTITGRVGTAAVVPQEILPANINQHIVRLRIYQDNCLPQYLAAYLNSSIGLSLSNRSVTGGTRIALDYEAIRSLQVPLPPIDVQEAIVNEVEMRRTKAKLLRQEAETEWEAAKIRFEHKLLGEEA